MLAALGIREADLVLLKELTKASDGMPYITDDLTLSNLSFLWRHAWLSKLLKFKAEDWKICAEDFSAGHLEPLPTRRRPGSLWKTIDHLKAAGFTPDELNWLLAADRSAKAAMKETDAARFLAALRKDLQAFRLNTTRRNTTSSLSLPPTDVDSLTALLTSLLQKLNRDEAASSVFLKTLREVSVRLEAGVQGVAGRLRCFPQRSLQRA